jgi:hypothetical protein
VLAIAIAAPLLAWVAAAQDLDDQRIRIGKMKADIDQALQMKMQTIGAVKGFTVKNAPYSGEEVNETNHVLADGTRIHRETHAMVYRDSEGRTRRETPDNITINDPVAGVTYILNPKTMSARKLITMQGFTVVHREDVVNAGGAGVSGTVTMRMESDGGTPKITVNGEELDQKKVQELMARAKADGDQVFFSKEGAHAQFFEGPVPPPMMLKKFPGESLGKRTIEGVNAEGTRNVNTIKAGTIGNDRDIQVTGENWYSPELQTMVMSKHSDPRTGEESFRLVNVNRNEPASYLFQVPAGYSINERK